MCYQCKRCPDRQFAGPLLNFKDPAELQAWRKKPWQSPSGSDLTFQWLDTARICLNVVQFLAQACTSRDAQLQPSCLGVGNHALCEKRKMAYLSYCQSERSEALQRNADYMWPDSISHRILYLTDVQARTKQTHTHTQTDRHTHTHTHTHGK